MFVSYKYYKDLILTKTNFMKKITLIMFAFLASVSLSQVNAQTYTGDTGAIPDNSCPALTPYNNAVAATGSVGSAVGEYTLDNVTLNISHTWDGDLEINLVSPSGVSLDLSSNNGNLNLTERVCCLVSLL